jgi:hypothetical protein
MKKIRSKKSFEFWHRVPPDDYSYGTIGSHEEDFDAWVPPRWPRESRASHRVRMCSYSPPRSLPRRRFSEINQSEGAFTTVNLRGIGHKEAKSCANVLIITPALSAAPQVFLNQSIKRCLYHSETEGRRSQRSKIMCDCAHIRPHALCRAADFLKSINLKVLSPQYTRGAEVTKKQNHVRMCS